jgi:transposase-like protein
MDNRGEGFNTAERTSKSVKCKYCSGENTIKHGRRQTKKGPVQIYLCRDCQRVFSRSPLPYMNTRSILVLRGISLYNQGYSLGQASQMLHRTFNERVPRNTLHYWTRNYSDLFTYLRIRKRKEPRLPLLPKVYKKNTFSLHRTKVSMLPKEMEPLSDYIYRAYRGIESGNLSGGILGGNLKKKVTDIHTRREFFKDPPESRIIRIAEENEENDPIRSVLINDDRSLCRNLPLYHNGGKDGRSFGFLDLLQYDENRIICLEYTKSSLDDTDLLRFLIGCGHALSQRGSVGMERIAIGAFNNERKWLVNLPMPMKKVRLQPKNN